MLKYYLNFAENRRMSDQKKKPDSQEELENILYEDEPAVNEDEGTGEFPLGNFTGGDDLDPEKHEEDDSSENHVSSHVEYVQDEQGAHHDDEDEDYDKHPVQRFFEDYNLEWIWNFIMLPKNTQEVTKFSKVSVQSVILGLSFLIVSMCGVIFFFAFCQIFGGMYDFLIPYYPESGDFLAKLDTGLQGRTGSIIGFMGLIGTIGSTFVCLNILEQYLDDSWGKLTSRKFEQQLTSYWVIITIASLPFLMALMLNKNLEIFHQFLGKRQALIVGSHIFHFALTGFSFAFVYKLFSKGTLEWRSCWMGSFWATLFFEVTKNLYFVVSMWQAKTQPIAATAFTFIFATFFWTFLSALYILYGGKIAFVFQNLDVFENLKSVFSQEIANSHQAEDRSLRPTREVALICLLDLTSKFLQFPKDGDIKEVGIDANQLSKLAYVDPEKAKKVLIHLQDVGLLTILHDGVREIGILRFSPDKVTIEEFLGRIERRYGKNIPQPLQFSANQWFWNEYSKALKTHFEGVNLRQLYERDCPGIEKELDSKRLLTKKIAS